MRLLGYIIVFAIVLFCNEVRAQEPGHCKKPDRLKEAELQGVWNAETYPPGKIATYSCRPGYVRHGSIKYVCAEGTWQILAKGQCNKRSCGHPEDIPFGTFELIEETEFVLGAVVEYSCEDGYQMVSKHKTRECTANGWSNFPPHCEVRKCPPVVVGGGVQLVSSSYDNDEYSVGQVIRFECKDAKLTINGNSEIFCTSDGEWSGNPPTCQETSCNLPIIENGRVLVPKAVYKEDEKLSFSCIPKYRKERNLDPVCTNRGWNPQPSCREIVCYPDYVENGKVIQIQNLYREGDTIELKCNDGFTIEHNPDLPRTCTADGWSPPLKCISKNCDKPQIEHGGLYYYSKYGYPRRINSEIEYWCEDGFLSTVKSYYGKSKCTANGWHPKPKCTVSCSNADAKVDNADIFGHQRIYVSGDKLDFTCKKGFSTADGKNSGQIECLPDGKFSKAKCHKFCNMESLKHGHYQPEKVNFELTEHLQYECDEGFISPQGNKVDKAQCTANGWFQEVKCNEIICSVNKNRYVDGDVVIFSCPRGYRLSGSEVSQCYYYGWDPALPICQEINYPYREGKLSEARQEGVSDCPPVPEPAYVQTMYQGSIYKNGDTVEMRCDPGFIRHGSNMTTCHNGKWSSPPQCIYSPPCYQPPGIENGGLTKESEKREYAAGDVVKYQCNTGYSISGSDESLCLNGRWQTTPTCTGNDCGRAKVIPYATIQNEKTNYKHADSAVYVCLLGYKLVGDNPAKCVNGEWKQIPACASSSCGSPPTVSFANPVGVKDEYKSGDKVKYKCVEGYAFEKNNEALCEDTRWKQIPVCRKIGESCGPAPVVQYAETLQPKQATYRSDFEIEYICPDYYIVEGNKKIKCLNGVWEEPPVCLEPCTAGEKEMKDNNIKLRWVGAPKLYSKHGEWIGFQCLNGFEIPDENALRVTCNRGTLNYPRCLKRGSCILSQQTMETNNIYINGSTEIKNGETIKFECYIGMEPENILTSTCRQGQINYPKCTNSRSCKLAPDILNGKLKTGNQDSFDSGSFVEIECNQGFELVGSISIQCNNGQWTEAPQCLESCEISSETLEQNNIELLSSDDLKKKHSHATHVNFKCKFGYVLSSQAASLKADCNNGKINYPKCSVGKKCLTAPEVLNGLMKTEEKSSYDTGSLVEFECKQNFVIGGRKKARCNDGQWTDLPRCLEPCEISPQQLQKNKIELVSSDDLEKKIMHGTQVNMKCSSGFISPIQSTQMNGECTNGIMKYPKCVSNPFCRLQQETLDEHFLELDAKHENVVYYGEGETVTFRCKHGFSINSGLTGICSNGEITFPTCKKKDACYINQQMLDDNHLEVHRNQQHLQYFENAENIEFTCRSGFVKKYKSTNLNRKCSRGTFSYPRGACKKDSAR